MSIQLQFRRGNTAQTAVFTGAVAELTVDTDKNTIILHDGVTAGGYALARESSLSSNQAFAQAAYNKANAAYDEANTKFDSAGGTISGDVILTGNITPTTDNVYSLGSSSYRWKDIFVGAGTVDIDGVKLSKVNNRLVVSGATDLVLSGTNVPSSTNTANNIANAFNQANLAYDAANTAYTAGGARAFDQANLAFDKANSAWDYANSAYATANNEILTRQANVGAAVISITGAYQANTGAALISAKSYTDTSNNYLQANIGAGLIAVTSAYQANVGAARIQVLGRADSAFAQANLAFNAANNVAPQIQPTRDVANSAFAQANLAYDKANVGGDFSGFANVASNVSIGTYLDLSTTQSTPSFKEGRIFYNNLTKSVSYFNETDDEIELGQKYTIRVWNNTASTISDGSAVYIEGSSSNGVISVALANAATAVTSEVIGLATMDIPAGAYGYVAGAGKIEGLNTSLLTPGQELYLSDTVPGGYTTVPPPSPSVPITIGYVVASDLTNGSILVNIHLMEGRNKTTGAILFARNDAIDEDPSHLYWDFANNRLGINTSIPQANLHVAGNALFTGNVTITGNLAISNAQSITTSELTVGGNVIILNSQFSGTPTVNADIVVNRGNEANVYIRWNEQINEWVMFDAAGYAEGHILHSEKTAKDWSDYSAMAAYEKLTHPIGADLANTINETAKAAFTQANTAITSGQANVGAAVISVTEDYQANVGAARIADQAASQANVGAGLIIVTSAYQANVGAGLISVTNAYQANVGAARIADRLTTNANVGSAIIQGQANVGAGLISVTNAYQANVGAGLITKVAKSGDTMTGTLSTSGSLIGSSITANTIVTVNTHSVYEATAVTTGSLSQIVLDSFSTTAYRSAKYLVQITSGSSYELLELTLIHDGTTVYLSQYGNIKTGATLGVFDATISAGTLNLLATPNNAVTTFKTAATLIPT